MDNFPFEHFLGNESQNNNFVNSILEKSEQEKSQEINNSQNDLEILNKELLSYIERNIELEKFQAYFMNSLYLISLNSNSLVFNVPTSFIKTMVEGNYKELISEAIKSTLGKSYKIEIQISNNVEGNYQEAKKSKNVKEASFQLTPSNDDLLSTVESKYIDHVLPNEKGIIIDSNKTFQSFVIGPSNNMACATAKAVAFNPGKSGRYPSLYIHSNSGLGKTHLLHAVANEIKSHHPSLVVCLITARDFMTEMINSIQNNKINDFRKKYSEKIDVLMIDDIHELKDKQGTQNEFFHIFSELHNKGKQLIFTSDKAPKEIDGIAERIKTRLQWGLVIDIQKPDLETRIAILNRKAKELDLFVPDDVLNLIASSIKTSIRELEGSLIKLSAFSDVMNVEIDTEMVKDLLNLNPDTDHVNCTIETISKSVSLYYKIPIADLKSKSRSKDIAHARHIGMFLSQKLLKTTLLEIGKFYGGRDHTSVIHGINKIKNNLKTDSQLSRELMEIENNI